MKGTSLYIRSSTICRDTISIKCTWVCYKYITELLINVFTSGMKDIKGKDVVLLDDAVLDMKHNRVLFS